MLRQRSLTARLHDSVQDVTGLSYGPDTFDAVVITNAPHMMPEPEKRFLKPAGC